MGVYDAEELDEIKTASLAGLGSILMDKLDALQPGEPPEVLNEIYGTIGKEVIYRCRNAEALEAMMDFHYKKWKDAEKSAIKPDTRAICEDAAYLEFKAMIAGFSTMHGK